MVIYQFITISASGTLRFQFGVVSDFLGLVWDVSVVSGVEGRKTSTKMLQIVLLKIATKTHRKE